MNIANYVFVTDVSHTWCSQSVQYTCKIYNVWTSLACCKALITAINFAAFMQSFPTRTVWLMPSSHEVYYKQPEIAQGSSLEMILALVGMWMNEPCIKTHEDIFLLETLMMGWLIATIYRQSDASKQISHSFLVLHMGFFFLHPMHSGNLALRNLKKTFWSVQNLISTSHLWHQNFQNYCICLRWL